MSYRQVVDVGPLENQLVYSQMARRVIGVVFFFVRQDKFDTLGSFQECPPLGVRMDWVDHFNIKVY